MSKTPSKKLYDLVHSLSGSEKRYFKLYANKKGMEKNNKYILLFNAIDRQTSFNEEALQLVVYKGAAIQSRKYSELKAYLYDLILKALQNYDEKTSFEYRIKGLLLNIRVLFKRGHFEDCKEVIQKAHKLAIKYEAFTAQLELLNWEKQLAYTQIDVDFFDKELDNIDQAEKTCLLRMQNLSAYRNIFFRLYRMLKKGAFLSRKDIKTHLYQLMDTSLIQDSNSPQSHQAKILYYRIYTLFHYASGNYEAFYKDSCTLLKLMESKSYFLKEDVSEYISALSNHTVSCRRTARYKEWEATLEKFQQIKPNTHDDELKIHRQYYQGQFSWCILTGDFEKGKSALEKHLTIVQQFDQALFARSAFYFQYFQIYFGYEDYDKALDYLNKWLSLPKSIERQDLQITARILNLIIHYEIGNSLLLESLLRSTYRYIKKADKLQPIERKILAFIKDSNKIYSKKEMKTYYLELQQELELLSNPKKIGPFDLAAWLESKIKRTSYAQIIQERFRVLSKQKG